MFFYSSFKQRKVVFAAGKITYLYTATGEKVQKKVTQGSTTIVTDYVDGFQYVAGALSFFPTAEGYFNAETQNYVYQHLDHLGNVRVSYSDANKNNKIDVGEIVVENNYYPFGLAHKGYNEKNNTIARNYKYQYNAKELQEELGFNVYDYGARNYDAAIGRWMNVDPLAEKMPSWNPYTYTFNNPIMFTDPTGMIGEGIENEYKVYTSGGQVQKVDYISNKGGDFVDHVTYVNLDTPAPYAPETTTEVQFVQHSESKIDTNLSVLNNETAQTIRGLGFKHDVKYHAQSQGIQPMEFDSPFFIIGGTLKGAQRATNYTSDWKILNSGLPKHGKFQYGLRNTKTNYQIRIERHRLQTANGGELGTHINYGIQGKKHYFPFNSSRYKPYVKE